MFETEVKEIQEKLKNTLEINAQMQELHRKHWKGYEAKKYFYFDSRVALYHKVYETALGDLERLIDVNATGKVGFDPYHGDEETFKKACEFVLNYKNEDTIEHFINTLTPYRYDSKPKYTVNGDTIEFYSHYYANLRLILNVLNILVNDKIEEKAVYEKCLEVLKEVNTFVYRNIKITCYKNGKVRLVFAEEKTLNKMKKLLEKVRSCKDE